MNQQVYNCDRPCSGAVEQPPRLIVLTGGPGAGKTAVLEFFRKIFCEHVAILPEAASILFSGGFWRISGVTGERSAQRAIFEVQKELETMFKEEKRWSLGLCDRGSLDGLAYWPGSEDDFFKSLNTTKEKEYAKYEAVIHLRAPAVKDYNHHNPQRIETAEAAILIDHKIHEVWKNHPKYHQISSEDFFSEKIYRAVKTVSPFLPACSKTKEVAK